MDKKNKSMLRHVEDMHSTHASEREFFVELKSSVNLVFMQPSSPHEMFILLGENNKLFDALIFNPVHTKEKQTLQRLKQLLLPCFSFRDVFSMAYLDIVRCYRARHWAAATEHGRDAVDR